MILYKDICEEMDNNASKKVAIKAGMEFECIRKAFILEDGIWTDNEIYSVIESCGK